MDKILELAKVVTVIQVLIITSFILLMYLTRYFFQYRGQKNAGETEEISNLFNTNFDQQQIFSPEAAKQLQKSIQQVLFVLTAFEKKHSGSDYIGAFNAQLSNLVLKPAARKWFDSWRWLERYSAARCYTYGFDAEDEKKLLHLINDKSLLVSINAATVAVNYSNPTLINEMITVYSEARRIRQSSFAEIIANGHPDIASIIVERLQKESNLYVKLFCYRLLCRLPVSEVVACVETDIKIDAVDLKIAVLEYLVHCGEKANKELIYPLANDANWQVRAAVAKALGRVDDKKKCISLLAILLSDSEWWVRINAANSLSQLGESGIEILKNQSPTRDKFAYEIAQVVLMARDEK